MVFQARMRHAPHPCHPSSTHPNITSAAQRRDANGEPEIDDCLTAMSVALRKKENKRYREWINLLDPRNLRMDDYPFGTAKEKLAALVHIGISQGIIAPNAPFGFELVSDIALDLIR